MSSIPLQERLPERPGILPSTRVCQAQTHELSLQAPTMFIRPTLISAEEILRLRLMPEQTSCRVSSPATPACARS